MKSTTSSLSKNPKNILVLGSTGKTGRRIAHLLSHHKVNVRTVSRSGAIPFDWNHPHSWQQALEGMDAVYISYAPDLAIPGAKETMINFVAKAITHGVKRLVLLSGRGEEEAQRCESIVKHSGLEWTVVRASWFAQNFSEGEFLGMVQNGSVTLPAGDVPEPFVDIDDIAEVAVAALTEPGHHEEIYEVTGPRLLTFADAVQEISSVLKRNIQYQQIPQESFNAAIQESGAPADIAWLLNYLFATVLDGRNASIGDGVQRALGRDPRDFSDFAHQVATSDLWKQSA